MHLFKKNVSSPEGRMIKKENISERSGDAYSWEDSAPYGAFQSSNGAVLGGAIECSKDRI
jgi:hypothetical protein